MGGHVAEEEVNLKQQTWKAGLRLWPVGEAILWAPRLCAYAYVLM